MRLLNERLYSVTRKTPVVCRLWRMTAEAPSPSAVFPVYAIGLESLTARYLYCVGSREEEARELFARIVGGKLSPVHLADVVEDFLWEQEQGGKETGEISESPLQSPQNMV